MKKVLFVIVLLIFICFPCFAGIDVKFTPSKQCEETIVGFINDSKETIDVAVYSINNDKIVEALKNAHNRGVKLRILTDRLQASSKSSKVIDLYEYGVNIRVNSKYKIEHNKFAIYDKKIVSTGSFNWTNPASDKNSENCLFLEKNYNAINKYVDRFEQLWRMNTKANSEKWFKDKEITR
ncbi:MAG: endonuclease [Alphaproteobacteria bacterium]|nr:endonuclease [Alphaproteobacteria bacterium]